MSTTTAIRGRGRHPGLERREGRRPLKASIDIEPNADLVDPVGRAVRGDVLVRRKRDVDTFRSSALAIDTVTAHGIDGFARIASEGLLAVGPA